MKKPVCKLIGEDGNIFNLLAIARRALLEDDLIPEANEMRDRVMASKSYNEALAIISEYVEIV